MARSVGVVVAMGAVLLSACADSRGSASPVPPGAEARLLDATFLLVPPGCAGVLLDGGEHALTAAHCLSGSEEELTLELRDGSRLAASVEHVDELRDVAILRLDEPDPGRAGLAIAPSTPHHGAVLFAGRPDRDTGLQVARVLRVGRCSSLPEVDAIFTTIDGAPGDSGAPVTDLQLRLVGLVHGGASCHIVTPVAGALASVERGITPASAVADSCPSCGPWRIPSGG